MKKHIKLVLTGNRTYIKRMFKHLKREHPSTRKRLRIVGGKL